MAQAQLKGSDTLFEVIKDVIAACPGATGNIVYIGGGSGARPVGHGRRAYSARGADVAPAERDRCTTNSRQLMIGLDGLSIVTKNVTGGAPATCTDDIGGHGGPDRAQQTFRRSSSSARPTRSA